MAKRAMLVGCNYLGSYCPLYGCINDVTNMRKILMEVYGFEKKNIVFMVDTDEKSLMPTGKNIVQQLGKSIRLQSLGMCFISISVATEGKFQQRPAIMRMMAKMNVSTRQI